LSFYTLLFVPSSHFLSKAEYMYRKVNLLILNMIQEKEKFD
jgi:hypothetical protein